MRTRLGYQGPYSYIRGVLSYEVGIVTSAIAIAYGLMTVTFSATRPRATMSATAPGIALTGARPGIAITGEG